MVIVGERMIPLKKGIKKRWVFNYTLILFALLILLEIGFILIDKNYLYSQTIKIMTSRAEFITEYYNKYFSQEKNNIELMSDYIVQDFNFRDQMQLSIYDLNGNQIKASGAYQIKNLRSQKDFIAALKNSPGILKFRDETGQNLISVSYPLHYNAEVIGVLNLLTRSDEVDRKLMEHIKVSIIFIIIILFIVFFSSLVFNKTILEPLNEINQASKTMANGDLSLRIEKRYDDEIGELAENLNVMANEIVHSQKIKNDFISSISHELRTPLTSIKGWSETILLSRIENPEVEKSVQIIKNESERLSKLVDELLDFSKIQSGRFNIQLMPIYLEDVLIEVVDMMMYRANEKNIQIHYESNLKSDKIMGDADRLRQVFINIIENAVKFTDNNAPIYVIAEEEIGMIRISIVDGGIGIEPKYLDKIKNNFFKVHANRQGSGLGLAISEQIVQLHEGTLTINSIEGEGTTVSIRLPQS